MSSRCRRIEKAGAEGAREFFETSRRGDASVNYAVAVDDFARVEAGFRYTLSLTQKGTTPYPVTIEVRDEQGHTIPSPRRKGAEHGNEITLPFDLEPVSGYSSQG